MEDNLHFKERRLVQEYRKNSIPNYKIWILLPNALKPTDRKFISLKIYALRTK